MAIDLAQPRISVPIAVLTVSDTRTEQDDRSGDILATMIEEDGHRLVQRAIVRDDVDAIRAWIRRWVDEDAVRVIVVTGGTGVTGRDVTPEAVSALFDKEIPGFGELFRMLSYQKIGSSTIQSRALAGVVGGVYVFVTPGSPGACRDAWEGILRQQLDNRFRPCNLVELLPRLQER